MKRFIGFGSIEQMRTIVKNVKHSASYQGQDENGEPIYDRTAKAPTLDFVMTEKIHGCFEKNSLVTLSNGEQVPISQISEGTYILSYNHKTKEQEVKKVIKSINQKLDKEWCKLVFDKTEIICTKDHKIWTENRGYIEAQNLLSTDIFKTA